tara:strand:- start:361 stop:648 length:288 start_codon:yes stop_codon:yes gene_type:complete
MTTAQEHAEILEAIGREPNPRADLIAQAQEIDRRFRAEERAKRTWARSWYLDERTRETGERWPIRCSGFVNVDPDDYPDQAGCDRCGHPKQGGHR